MKCLYCGYQMTKLDADQNAPYICDCGAVGENNGDAGVYFQHEAESRQNWLNLKFFRELNAPVSGYVDFNTALDTMVGA